MKSPLILGIESSCDDTSAGICLGNKILANVTANQDIHGIYGGVVPELASRAHQQNILPVIDTAMKQAKISPKDLDAIAFTAGPGLLGSLLVGTSFAKSLAFGLNIPLIEVNHMQAHILAHFIDDGNIAVPESIWKVLLILDEGNNDLIRIYDDTRVIAVDIPNRNDVSTGTDWHDYMTTVDDIETKTGYDIFSNLPFSLQNTLEQKVDQGPW